jgi:RNA polymerase sigma factor (sigma-70 family)
VNASLCLSSGARPTFGPFGRRELLFGPAGAPSRQLCRVQVVDDAAELDAERGLVERAQAGERDALGAILRKHGPRLYRSVLLPRLGSAASAEEALSRTYVKVIERFDQFAWQAVGVYPWLRVVALRVALDMLRARKRELLFEPEDVEFELDRAEQDAREADELERYDLNCAKQRVRDVLGRINPRYADAIRLRVLEERSREEAALSLGVSVATFDVVLHRAMAALRKALPEGGTGS